MSRTYLCKIKINTVSNNPSTTYEDNTIAVSTMRSWSILALASAALALPSPQTSSNTTSPVVGVCNTGQVYCLSQITHDLGISFLPPTFLLGRYTHTYLTQASPRSPSCTSTATRKRPMIGSRATGASVSLCRCRIAGSAGPRRGGACLSVIRTGLIRGQGDAERGMCVLRVCAIGTGW
jgi:hypothetical protein